MSNAYICKYCNKTNSSSEQKCNFCEEGVKYEKYLGICRKCQCFYVYAEKYDGYYYEYSKNNRKSEFIKILCEKCERICVSNMNFRKIEINNGR